MQYLPPPSKLKPGSVVWTYLRDSGGEGQDRSVARQEETLRAYCLKYNLALDDRFIFRDIAKSGKSVAGREEFNRMIELSEDRDIRPDAVILWNYSRFARNASQAIYYISMLRNRGIIVYSITDPIPESKYSIIIEDSIHIGNEERREQISRDVREQLHQLVTNYGAMFGRPPRGLKREPLDVTIPNPRTGKMRTLNKWVPDPDVTHLIRQAFTMRANGESFHHIGKATHLFDSINSWPSFFSNKIYKGILEYGGLVIEDYCEPIVSPELWQAVQIVNQKRGHARSGTDNPRRVNSSFILSGRVFCQHCGGPMNGYNIKAWNYYACSRRIRRHDCEARRIPRDALEQAVIEALLDQLLSLESLLALQIRMQEAYERTRTSTRQERLDLDRRLRTVKGKISNLTNAIAERGHSKSLLAALDEAETLESELLLQLSALEQASHRPPKYDRPSLAQLAEWVSDELRNGTRDQQRYILRSLITRIIAKRTDTHILAAVYYIPPQLAFENQISSPNDREGNKVYGEMPPRRYMGEDLIAELFIPIRKHKAPLPR